MRIARLSLVWISILTFVKITSQSVPKDYTSYRILPLCIPSDYFRYPTSIQEVVDIVQEAISRKTTVKVVGGRHSQTDIICTEGIPVDNRGLKSFRLNSDNTATLGAGLTLKEAAEFLKDNDRAFRTTPAYGDLTLAGSVATGAHGSSIKYTSTLSEQVVGMTIVDGTGQIRNISTEEDLKAFRVHLGLLGVIIDITFITQPLYKTRAFNHIVSDEILTNGVAGQWAREADQMSLYWFPSLKQVVVSNWTIVDVDTPGDAFTNDHVPSTYTGFNLIISPGTELIQGLATSKCSLASSTGYSILHLFESYFKSTLLTQTPGFVPIYTEDGITVKNPATGYYDRMFAPTCNEEGPNNLQCAWAHGDINSNITLLDNEMSLDLDDLPNFILTVKDILTKGPAAFPFQGILMRFSAASDSYMSTSYGRDSVHFEFYLFNRKQQTKDPAASLAVYQTIMQTQAKAFGGRSHWGKSGMVYHDSEMLDLKLDPEARSNFITIMKKYDPKGVFMNNFGKRLSGVGNVLDADPKASRCALLDYCFCSEDDDCGDNQRCVELRGYDYPVCQTIGERANLFPLSVPFTNIPLFDWIKRILPGVINNLSLLCLFRGEGLDIPLL